MHPQKIHKMKSLKLYALIAFATTALLSCKDDDDKTSITPPRDYGEQYATESLEIEEYIATHYLEGTGLNAQIIKIPENGSQTPISQLTSDILKEILVNKHDIQYKVYYIQLNEGVNQRPSHVDSVFVSYKGWLLDGTQFDYSPNSIWLSHDNIIDGLTYFYSELKTGIYNTETNSFEGSGSGIAIIPSGLGYYNASRTSIPAYSPLVFNLNLNTLKYRDHDQDGIPSRFEAKFYNEYVEDTNENRDPRNYDSNGDGLVNYLDIDDDGDGILTRKEIEKNTQGELYSFDEIPSCNGVKVHLDTSCAGPILEP